MNQQPFNDEEMSPQEVLDVCIHMHNKAFRSQGVAKRISYQQIEREAAIGVLSAVQRNGGSAHVAAAMMGMNVNTLRSWEDKATAPDTDWNVRFYKHMSKRPAELTDEEIRDRMSKELP